MSVGIITDEVAMINPEDAFRMEFLEQARSSISAFESGWLR